jgi:hypothetical protein
MYGNTRSVKREITRSIALRFFVGMDRQTLWFGRFRPQLSHADALREFANHVRLLTALVRSFPISLRPLSVLKPMQPMAIRVLLQMS